VRDEDDGGSADPVAEPAVLSFGASSGQYQPGIAWKPDAEDMFSSMFSGGK
jgi:hypothetical protein